MEPLTRLTLSLSRDGVPNLEVEIRMDAAQKANLFHWILKLATYYERRFDAKFSGWTCPVDPMQESRPATEEEIAGFKLEDLSGLKPRPKDAPPGPDDLIYRDK